MKKKKNEIKNGTRKARKVEYGIWVKVFLCGHLKLKKKNENIWALIHIYIGDPKSPAFLLYKWTLQSAYGTFDLAKI